MTGTPVSHSPSLGAAAWTSALGQTRSRTLLFLSYRASSAKHSALSEAYTDDPLGATSEERGLLDARASHVSLDMHAELPPKWMDISDTIDQLLASIQPRLLRLSALHEKHLRPGFADKSAEEQQIDRLTLDITKDFRRCSQTVATFAMFTHELAQDVKQQRSTVRQLALASNMQTALATRVQDLSGAFRKQQSLYLQRMKGMEVRDRDLRAAQGLALTGFKDSETAMREDMELSSQQLDSSLLFDGNMSQSDLDIQQRSHEINSIAKSIQDLAHLFGDLQTLVIDQGTLLDRIDYNVELMSTEMQGAVRELDTATRYQRRSGRRQFILFLLLLIAVLIAIIIVKPFWRSFRTL